LKGRIFGPKKGKDEGYRTVDEGNYIIICFIIFYFSPNNFRLTVSRSNKQAGYTTCMGMKLPEETLV
jgi:hypothetical protein